MYDHQEQEKIEDLKVWWKIYGKYVSLGLIVTMLGYAIYQGYQYYQRQQNEKAGVLFDAIQNAFKAQDEKVALSQAKLLQEQFPTSALASRGALVTASLSHQKGKDEEAMSELVWVENHSREPMLADLARVRHAGVLADKEKYYEALDLLNQNKDPAMLPLTLDLKGDIYTVLGKNKEARQTYQTIIDKAGSENTLFKQLAVVKRDALGGATK